MSSSALAQNSDFKRWEFGLNVGGYKAHKYTSVRYDGFDGEYQGDGAKYVYDFGVDYYLGLGTSSPYSIYNQIRQQYNDLDFQRHQFPENMRYNLGLALGVHIGSRFDEFSSFFVDIDIANLKLADALTFEIDDPANQTAQPTLEIEQITGKERRLSSNIGLHFGLGDDVEGHPYFEIGGNITAVRVEENAMIVKERKYVLTQWSRNANRIYSQADYGSLGYGVFAGLGYRMRLQEQLPIDVGATCMFTRVGLGPNTPSLPYKFRPQFQFYIRAMWG